MFSVWAQLIWQTAILGVVGTGAVIGYALGGGPVITPDEPIALAPLVPESPAP